MPDYLQVTSIVGGALNINRFLKEFDFKLSQPEKTKSFIGHPHTHAAVWHCFYFQLDTKVGHPKIPVLRDPKAHCDPG